MYTRIIVPLDGSTFAEAALPLALDLCQRSGASLHLVTVLEPVPPYGDDRWGAEAREWLTSYLEKVADRARQLGVEATTALRSGYVVDDLLLEARREHADLIVVATHGRGPLARAWLGSVADALSRQAEIPLMLVRPREGSDQDLDPPTVPRTILVPLDGSELSECALEHAIELGRLFGSAYHLTRIVPLLADIQSPYVPYTVQLNHELLAEAKVAAADYLEQLASRMRWRGLRVTTSVAVGQPGYSILAEAEAVGCDMIAMATHGSTGIRRVVLGSAADKVLRGTQLPLMLFRPTSVPAELVGSLTGVPK
jgi:nucleotide-binding universal stress UspA family protein